MKTKKTVLILLSILLIAGIIGSVYYFKSSKANNPKEPPVANAEAVEGTEDESEIGTMQDSQAENTNEGLNGIEDVGGDVEIGTEIDADTQAPAEPEPPKVETPKPQPKPETPKPETPPTNESAPITDWSDPSMALPGQNITPGGAGGDKGAVRLP